MNDEITKSYKDRSVWLRGLYMLVFIFVLGVAKFVTLIVVIFQFITVLLTAVTNQKLVHFGKSLSIYNYQVMLFLTYNSEEYPFPIGDWPEHVASIEDH